MAGGCWGRQLQLCWAATQTLVPCLPAEACLLPPCPTHPFSSWGQADRGASFLEQPARPRNGMPSKPTVGIAVSIKLDLAPSVVDDFFRQGGA